MTVEERYMAALSAAEAERDLARRTVVVPTRSYTAAEVQEAFERGVLRGEQDANERNNSRRQHEQMTAPPTPTAEPCCNHPGNHPGNPNWHTVDGSHVVPPDVEEDTPVTPPSITDMAPGTTFEYPERWEVGPIGLASGRRMVISSDGNRSAYLEEFDPSTIRDVREPK